VVARWKFQTVFEFFVLLKVAKIDILEYLIHFHITHLLDIAPVLYQRLSQGSILENLENPTRLLLAHAHASKIGLIQGSYQDLILRYAFDVIIVDLVLDLIKLRLLQFILVVIGRRSTNELWLVQRLIVAAFQDLYLIAVAVTGHGGCRFESVFGGISVVLIGGSGEGKVASILIPVIKLSHRRR
jgi:hypothetical protein